MSGTGTSLYTFINFQAVLIFSLVSNIFKKPKTNLASTYQGISFKTALPKRPRCHRNVVKIASITNNYTFNQTSTKAKVHYPAIYKYIATSWI